MRTRSAHRVALLGGLVAVLAAAAPTAGLTILFDYRYDRGFFTDPNVNPDAAAARAALEHAAGSFSMYRDELAAIEPRQMNTWNALFTDPSDQSQTVEVPNLIVPAGSVVVFVGAADIAGTTLAVAGPGGYSDLRGMRSWRDAVKFRGQGGAAELPPTDFGPWGGAITMDSAARWHYDPSSPPPPGVYDFLSVAVHELAHVLGFGLSESFDACVDGASGAFTGPAATAVHGGPVPLAPDLGHWAPGTEGANGRGIQEAAMDPDVRAGTRKLLTDLDVAGMADVGWEMPEPGDADSDGDVDAQDYLAVKAHFGQVATWAEGDFDFDQDVDRQDLLALAGHFTGPGGSGGDPAVPEPAWGAAGLLAFGGWLLSGRRRRR